VCASSDGRWIAVGSYGGQIAFFEIEKRVWQSVVRPTISGISCLSQGRGETDFIASAYDGQLYTLNATTNSTQNKIKSSFAKM